MGLLRSAFALLILASSTSSLAQNTPGTTEIELPSGIAGTFVSDLEPGGITSFFTIEGSNKYWVEPRPHIDLSEAQAKYADKCAGTSSADERYRFRFSIHMYPGEVLEEAIKKIKDLREDGTGVVEVVPHPYRKLTIVYGAHGDEPIAIDSRYKGDVTNPLIQSLTKIERSTMELTCDQANEILDGDGWADTVIDLELATVGFNAYSLEAQASQYLLRELAIELDRTERAEGQLRYVSRGRSSSGGLLGGIFGGSTSSKNQTGEEDTRQRFITAKALNDSLETYRTKISIDLRVRGLEIEPQIEQKFIDDVFNELRTKFESQEAQFKDKANCSAEVRSESSSPYCLAVGAAERPVSDGEWKHVVDSINSAIASNSASYEGACGNSESAASEDTCKLDSSASVSGSINLKISGDPEKKWIPTSFDVYGISAETFSSSSQYELNKKVYSSVGGIGNKLIDVQDEIKSFDQFKEATSKVVPFVTEVRLDQLFHHSTPVDHSKLVRYCGDENGCTVSLSMHNYNPDSVATGVPASRGPHQFFFNPETNNWRASIDSRSGNKDPLGQLGDGVVRHALRGWGCFFSEGKYNNALNGTDNDISFHVMASGREAQGHFPYIGKVCKVTIRD